MVAASLFWGRLWGTWCTYTDTCRGSRLSQGGPRCLGDRVCRGFVKGWKPKVLRLEVANAKLLLIIGPSREGVLNAVHSPAQLHLHFAQEMGPPAWQFRTSCQAWQLMPHAAWRLEAFSTRPLPPEQAPLCPPLRSRPALPRLNTWSWVGEPCNSADGQLWVLNRSGQLRQQLQWLSMACFVFDFGLVE